MICGMKKSDFFREITEYFISRKDMMENGGFLVTPNLPFKVEVDNGVAFQGSLVDCFGILFDMYRRLEAQLMLTQTINLGNSRIEIIYFEYKKNPKINVYKMVQSDIKIIQ